VPILRYLLLLLVVLPFAAAVQSHAEGERIAEIRIDGNHRIEAAAILNVISLKAGDTLYSDKTDADIRAIYKMGHFQDVQASVETAPSGAILVYTVQEKPIVREIRFEGTKKLTPEKLKEGLELRVNSTLAPKDIAKSVAKIKKLYGDEGYYLAEVEPAVTRRSATELLVTFKITEGEQILIKKITFDGNKAFSSRKLKKVMETKEKWFLSWLTGAGTYKEEVLKNDALLIADHYMNNGYLNIKVGEPVVKLNSARDALEVSISLTEGEQFRTGTIGFKGELLEPEAVLRNKLKLETGTIFSRAVLKGDIATLTDVYADKGYAFANVNPLTTMHADTKTVDLTFEMEKGELVSIERINVAGNLKTRDKVIRRELRVTEGELYSATGMKRSKQNLMNTGYFDEATVATVKGSASNKLNVSVDVKEKPTGTFSVGGGYSSLDGMIAQGSVSQSNFLGLGLKGNISGSLGGRSQTYSLGLTDPYFLDSLWTLGADIYRSERDYLDYTRRLTGGDIKAGYPLNDDISLFTVYRYEIKEIYNAQQGYQDLHNVPITGALYYPINTTTTSSIFFSIGRNTTDYRLDPSTGMINALSAEYAGLGGDNKFARYNMENTIFHPLYKKLIFSTKLTLGYIQEAGKLVPIDEKFYLGGIYSLRGYKSRTVSPTTQINGHVVYLGGNKEAFSNTEITFPVLQEFGVKGVAFFDCGTSNDNSFNKMFNSLLMSYGGGIRWTSPMGPLRLEYGIPINPRGDIDSKNGRFEFSIGSLF
jgi:outer membrane protein insertion porin family